MAFQLAGPNPRLFLAPSPLQRVTAHTCRRCFVIQNPSGRQAAARAISPCPVLTQSAAAPAHPIVQVQTLRKYTKQYEVQGVHPTSSKEDIAKAVTEHWNALVRPLRLARLLVLGCFGWRPCWVRAA